MDPCLDLLAAERALAATREDIQRYEAREPFRAEAAEASELTAAPLTPSPAPGGPIALPSGRAAPGAAVLVAARAGLPAAPVGLGHTSPLPAFDSSQRDGDKPSVARAHIGKNRRTETG